MLLLLRGVEAGYIIYNANAVYWVHDDRLSSDNDCHE
jgi:hypothetical protein